METETLEYTKVREVKSPTRAHPTDAGIDFYVPSNLTGEDMQPKYATSGCWPKAVVGDNGCIQSWELKPGESILIPSGIKVKVPDGCALVFMNKSGIGSKKHFSALACVTGNSIIETNHGKFSAISLTKEFCDNNDIKIKTFNHTTNKYEFNTCDGFRQCATSQCIKITFDDGSSIEGDENHHIWHNNKWIALKDL